MGVVDRHLWGIGHGELVLEPAIAEFSIFPRRQRKGGVKPPDSLKLLYRHGKVVGRKKAGLVTGVVVVVEIVDQDLAGG